MPPTRPGKHDPRSIRKVRREILAITAQMDSFADAVAQLPQPVITVEYNPALPRLDDLNRWMASARDGLTKAMDEAGAFRADDSALSQDARRAKFTARKKRSSGDGHGG